MPKLSNIVNLEPEKIEEMAMVDLSYQLLSETKKPQYYRDLFNQVVELKQISEQQAMDVIAQVYTEINLDGRFICLGDNLWGLKRWYLVETQEESAEGSLRGKMFLDDDDEDEEYEEEIADYDALHATKEADEEDADIEDEDLDEEEAFEEDEEQDFDEELEDESEEDEDEELDM
ncbi:DNA-directed RNA polymerase subunit delta [Aneurinibacillus sp. Ricciae_BoGa-3]|uniref:DNA-directed RNA polymerase subunit delta n=1 Tax=Aneurinibacillus sp. Ricciae_BoGa-3 TaxID=3022697 RepID=UPI00233F87F2|nr:DNA-directed RNA polymerase subunit delta [Aneurinibacillus sp. Ricciae_BoGa-3]WCK54377.1 DNA-directed RNA polymerase subunit delta [Aneurinibacillus sp. Ricciae_BoGa-3]